MSNDKVIDFSVPVNVRTVLLQAIEESKKTFDGFTQELVNKHPDKEEEVRKDARQELADYCTFRFIPGNVPHPIVSELLNTMLDIAEKHSDVKVCFLVRSGEVAILGEETRLLEFDKGLDSIVQAWAIDLLRSGLYKDPTKAMESTIELLYKGLNELDDTKPIQLQGNVDGKGKAVAMVLEHTYHMGYSVKDARDAIDGIWERIQAGRILNPNPPGGDGNGVGSKIILQ